MSAGIYFIILKNNAIGISAGKNIYIDRGIDVEKRVDQEMGRRSGAATFFRSIGLLLEKDVIPGSGKDFMFYECQEIARWLAENVVPKSPK